MALHIFIHKLKRLYRKCEIGHSLVEVPNLHKMGRLSQNVKVEWICPVHVLGWRGSHELENMVFTGSQL